MTSKPTVRVQDHASGRQSRTSVRDDTFPHDLRDDALPPDPDLHATSPTRMRGIPFVFRRSDHAAERLVTGDLQA
ncbi:hypothetical protein [Planobispora takensis]|uniref:Uncharacterized protein n=1 Tax=Planobispora takensis TaxID=1367882 RepID=A0A8J3T305_9ACTN|nr:hypothetical protein [Planobispora takensis]GII05369.1 hypothetical protein Pta02_73770 [Planobispora takensis]